MNTTPLPTRNCYGVDCRGWSIVHPRANYDMLGYLPLFIFKSDERPARVQYNERYQYGGWQPINGFTLWPDGSLKYPEDPALPPLLEFTLRDETLTYHGYGLVRITQKDGTWEVARMD